MTNINLEPVAYRYTASRSFSRRDRKWHYQKDFPSVDNRNVHELGKVQDLYTGEQIQPLIDRIAELESTT